MVFGISQALRARIYGLLSVKVVEVLVVFLKLKYIWVLGRFMGKFGKF